MIPFRSFVTNNARRYEKGERDHNAVAGALLLASGCTEAPTAGVSLRSMIDRVQGLSNNAAFREGRLSLYADIEGVIEEVFASPERLERADIKKRLKSALYARARDDASSKAYMVTGVAPKSESRENRELRARVQELEKQLSDEVQKVHQLRGVNTELRNRTRGVIVDTSGDFVSTSDLLRERNNLHEALRQEVERREADTKILRDENAQLREADKMTAKLAGILQEAATALKLPVGSDYSLIVGEARYLRRIVDRDFTVSERYEERHAFTINGVKFAPVNGDTAARDTATRVRSSYVAGARAANAQTARLLKEELSKVSGFDASKIPAYDPSKPGAVSAAVVEAVRQHDRDRFTAGCRESHKAVDGWLLHFMRELGCGATEIGEVAEWTRVEHHGNTPFKVARGVILRRVMGLLKKIAQDAMPVGLPRPWGNGEATPASIESAAEQLVQEIKGRAVVAGDRVWFTSAEFEEMRQLTNAGKKERLVEAVRRVVDQLAQTKDALDVTRGDLERANEGWTKSAMNKDAELADVEAKLSEFGLFRPKDIRLSTFVGTALAAGKAQLLDATRKVEDLRKQNIDLSRSKAEMANANARLWNELSANVWRAWPNIAGNVVAETLANRVARFIATGGREW